MRRRRIVRFLSKIDQSDISFGTCHDLSPTSSGELSMVVWRDPLRRVEERREPFSFAGAP